MTLINLFAYYLLILGAGTVRLSEIAVMGGLS